MTGNSCRRTAVLLIALGFWLELSGQELLPIETYSSLPRDSLVTLSPDGTRIAKRMVDGERDIVAAIDIATGKIVKAVDARNVKPTSIRFLNNDTLLIKAGETQRRRVRNPYEFSTAYEFDLVSGDIRVLLQNAPKLYPHQSGLGKVVGLSNDGKSMYVPAHIRDETASRIGPRTYGYYEIRLGSRLETVVESGTDHTIDWFVDGDGRPIVRVDFNDDANEYSLWRYNDGNRELLYSKENAERPALNIVGITADKKALVIREEAEEGDVDKYYEMNIADGSVSNPILGRDDLDVRSVITDMSRTVIGARYTGFKPSYQFLDPDLDAKVRAIQARFGDAASTLVGWSADNSRLLFHVTGSISAGVYILMDGVDAKPLGVAQSRPAVKPDQLAEIQIREYKARDGLTIPALVTGKSATIRRGNAPLIVLPHGGPASNDRYGFYWTAQFFASRGYVVLQPQFRGSTGFGNAHRAAGKGEWHDKMQTDIDDGVQFLIDEGIADEQRVCIAGASYGGYAALMAGAFSPFPYRCIVSIAGVSDRVESISRERRDHGERSWILDHWRSEFGVSLDDKEFLDSISPARHAGKFNAPVLLIHGRDDTVVPPDQSRRMHRALRKADKDVTYEILRGGDHWMREAQTRIDSLRLMSDFVEKHNPAD